MGHMVPGCHETYHLEMLHDHIHWAVSKLHGQTLVFSRIYTLVIQRGGKVGNPMEKSTDIIEKRLFSQTTTLKFPFDTAMLEEPSGYGGDASILQDIALGSARCCIPCMDRSLHHSG